jgi:hypothetical protein
MLYVGEHIAKLNDITDHTERQRFYLNKRTPTVSKLFRLILSDIRWKDCVKGRTIMFDPEPYGRNVSNLHREFPRLAFFTVGHGYDQLSDAKTIELFDKMLMALHHDEATLVNDIINGQFILDNAFEGEFEWVVTNFPNY